MLKSMAQNVPGQDLDQHLVAKKPSFSNTQGVWYPKYSYTGCMISKVFILYWVHDVQSIHIQGEWYPNYSNTECMISKVFISYRGHIILNSQNIFIQGAWYPNYSYYTGGITSKVFIYRVHNSLSPIWQLPEWCCLSNRWHVCFLSMLGC